MDDSIAEIPTDEQLIAIREHRRKEQRMWALIREIVLNFVFVCMLVVGHRKVHFFGISKSAGDGLRRPWPQLIRVSTLAQALPERQLAREQELAL